MVGSQREMPCILPSGLLIVGCYGCRDSGLDGNLDATLPYLYTSEFGAESARGEGQLA